MSAPSYASIHEISSAKPFKFSMLEMANLASSIVKYYQWSRIILQKVLSLTKMLYLRSTILVVIVSILFFNLEKHMVYERGSNLSIYASKILYGTNMSFKIV